MSSRPISSSGCKESGDAASCSSPPAKRLRLSGDAGADDDLDEGGKALRQSVAAILPPDIWARALSHLAFEDVKQCTAVDRYMAFEVSPAIKYDSNFTLKLGVPIPERVDLASVGRRFRDVKNVEIVHTMSTAENIADTGCAGVSASIVRDIVSSITPNATSLKIVGLGGSCTFSEIILALTSLRNHLKRLSLEGPCIDLKTIALGLDGLRRLNQLEISLDNKNFRHWDKDRHEREQMLESFCLSIGILGEIDLPSLAELKLIVSRNDDLSPSFFISPGAHNGFRTGIGKIKQLKALKSNALGIEWNRGNGIESFGSMLKGLKNLESLSTVLDSEDDRPAWETWAPHLQRLSTLSYNCFSGLPEEIRSFVHSMNGHLIALKTLKIIIENNYIGEDEWVVMLSELKNHPSLTNIILDVFFGGSRQRDSAEIIASRLQELVGDRITVIVGEGVQDSVEFD